MADDLPVADDQTPNDRRYDCCLPCAVNGRAAVLRDLGQIIQDGIEDETRFPVCPWCWPADHEDRADAEGDPGRFHFDESCALMELLDHLTEDEVPDV